MKTSEYIKLKIDRLPKRYVFTYDDFISEVNKKEAIIKALNRMVAAGKICKLAKGKYYKPKNSVFGLLYPDEYQTVKDLLERDGKIIGYLTGMRLFNQLSLTTQFSFTIQIGRNEIRPKLVRDGARISFIRQKNTITKKNIPLLQILDAIRYIKIIPDTSTESLCKRLQWILRGLPNDAKITLVKLALKYPPATRALVGALLETKTSSKLTLPLQKSLNQITSYHLIGIEKVLTSAKKWNFK